MTNVVDFNAARKNRTAVAPKPKKAPVQQEMNLNLNESYFVNLGFARLDFGGAFVRDLLAKAEENADAVKETLRNMFESQMAIISKMKQTDEREFLEGEFKSFLDDSSVAFVALMKTKNLEPFMSESSPHIHVIPLLISSIMVVSYTPFDLHRMIKQNWCMVSISPEELIEILEEVFMVTPDTESKQNTTDK